MRQPLAHDRFVSVFLSTSFSYYTDFEMHVWFSDLKSPGRISRFNVTMVEERDRG